MAKKKNKAKFNNSEKIEAPVEVVEVEVGVESPVDGMNEQAKPETDEKIAEATEEKLDDVNDWEADEMSMPQNMLDLYYYLLQNYILMLGIHIHVKTLNHEFHEETQERYELLFDIAHEVGERFVDLGWELFPEYNIEALAVKAKNLLEETKDVLDKCIDMKKDNPDSKMTKWVQALLTEKISKLEFEIGNARSFVRTPLSNE